MRFIDIFQDMEDKTYMYFMNSDYSELKQVNSNELNQNVDLGILNSKRVYRFFVDEYKDQKVLILTVKKDKVVINLGILKDDKLFVSSEPDNLYFDLLAEGEIKNFCCNSLDKREIYIISLNDGEIIKESFDKKTGKEYISLKEDENYIAIQLRKEKEKDKDTEQQKNKLMAIGVCRFTNTDGKYSVVMEDKGVKKIYLEKVLERFDKNSFVDFNIKNDGRELLNEKFFK